MIKVDIRIGTAAFLAGALLSLTATLLFGLEGDQAGLFELRRDPILRGGLPLFVSAALISWFIGNKHTRIRAVVGYSIILFLFVPVGEYWYWGTDAAVIVGEDNSLVARVVVGVVSFLTLILPAALCALLMGVVCWTLSGEWRWLPIATGTLLTILARLVVGGVVSILLRQSWSTPNLSHAALAGAWVGSLAAQYAVYWSARARASAT